MKKTFTTSIIKIISTIFVASGMFLSLVQNVSAAETGISGISGKNFGEYFFNLRVKTDPQYCPQITLNSGVIQSVTTLLSQREVDRPQSIWDCYYKVSGNIAQNTSPGAYYAPIINSSGEILSASLPMPVPINVIGTAGYNFLNVGLKDKSNNQISGDTISVKKGDPFYIQANYNSSSQIPLEINGKDVWGSESLNYGPQNCKSITSTTRYGYPVLKARIENSSTSLIPQSNSPVRTGWLSQSGFNDGNPPVDYEFGDPWPLTTQESGTQQYLWDATSGYNKSNGAQWRVETASLAPGTYRYEVSNMFEDSSFNSINEKSYYYPFINRNPSDQTGTCEISNYGWYSNSALVNSIQGQRGKYISENKFVTVVVTSATPPDPVNPASLTLTANGSSTVTTIQKGGNADLAWTSSGLLANSCITSWNPSTKAVSGGVVTQSAVNSARTYKIWCKKTDGTPISSSVKVNVTTADQSSAEWTNNSTIIPKVTISLKYNGQIQSHENGVPNNAGNLYVPNSATNYVVEIDSVNVQNGSCILYKGLTQINIQSNTKVSRTESGIENYRVSCKDSNLVPVPAGPLQVAQGDNRCEITFSPVIPAQGVAVGSSLSWTWNVRNPDLNPLPGYVEWSATSPWGSGSQSSGPWSKTISGIVPSSPKPLTFSMSLYDNNSSSKQLLCSNTQQVSQAIPSVPSSAALEIINNASVDRYISVYDSNTDDLISGDDPETLASNSKKSYSNLTSGTDVDVNFYDGVITYELKLPSGVSQWFSSSNIANLDLAPGTTTITMQEKTMAQCDIQVLTLNNNQPLRKTQGIQSLPISWNSLEGNYAYVTVKAYRNGEVIATPLNDVQINTTQTTAQIDSGYAVGDVYTVTVVDAGRTCSASKSIAVQGASPSVDVYIKDETKLPLTIKSTQGVSTRAQICVKPLNNYVGTVTLSQVADPGLASKGNNHLNNGPSFNFASTSQQEDCRDFWFDLISRVPTNSYCQNKFEGGGKTVDYCVDVKNIASSTLEEI